MAMVLDAFVRKLAFSLAGMAKDKVEMLLGVPGEIKKLETTLGDLSSILADAERRRIRDSAVERWVTELKDVMYDADNVLDLCQIMEGGGGPSLAGGGSKSVLRCWKNIPMLSCFRNPVAAHEIRMKIQALNQRLLDIEKRSSRFGFISQAINSSSSYSANGIDNSLQKTAPAMIRSDIVGEKIEEDTWKLVNLLINKWDARAGWSSSTVVAAVTGTGGIGKTTLAKMVFNDDMVTENFDKKIWLSVNKEVNEISILQSVVAAVGGNYNGFAGDKAQLEDALKRAVKQKKLLLVMDDVWTDKVWNELLRAPLNDSASGSRVFITTRNDQVARRMRAQYIHRVEKLEREDAWSLLKKQVVSNGSDEAEVNRLEDIGIKIVERCDRLPLAVKVVGGLLLVRGRTRGAWMDVLNHYAWTMAGTNDDLDNAVYMSYEELPSHLKQCLLYCSLIRKGVFIEDAAIVRMWIAEGFVQTITTSKQPEDLGLEYYRELISRNLLEPDKAFYDQSGCTVHDVVRSFSQFVAKHEGLLIEGEQGNTNSSQLIWVGGSSTFGNTKLRHISISSEVAELDALKTPESLRTLMLFRSTKSILKDCPTNLCCLRVLHITDVNLAELPDSVCHLKHLRYLGLRGTSISTVPEGIGDLNFLQLIDLQGCKNLSQLPNSILKLQKLRFINIEGTKITSIPRCFGELKDLVKVLGFPTHSDCGVTDGWCSLDELGSLSKLKAIYIGGLEKASSGLVAARAKLSSKLHLTRLDLIFTSRLEDTGEVKDHIVSKEEQERIEEVLANLCPPTCIELLTIDGYFGQQLPRWMGKMSVFDSLRRLVLRDLASCKQLPSGLCQLPFLDYLWVERAPSIECIGYDLLLPALGCDRSRCMDASTLLTSGTEIAETRQHHPPSSSADVAFPKLKTLRFEGMLGWEEWEWEQKVTAMPALEELGIHNCKLRYLPAGLAYHASTLRLLELKNISQLVCIENFPSLVELRSIENPKLERIANSQSLRQIYIARCPHVNLLHNLPSLKGIKWEDMDAEALPDYLRDTKIYRLHLNCSLSLLKLISLQDASSEWGKIEHVHHLKAIGWKSKEDQRDRHVYYTKEPYSFDANMGEYTDSSGSNIDPSDHDYIRHRIFTTLSLMRFYGRAKEPASSLTEEEKAQAIARYLQEEGEKEQQTRARFRREWHEAAARARQGHLTGQEEPTP